MSPSVAERNSAFPPWGQRMVLASRLAMLVLCWLLAATSASVPTLVVPLLALTALAAIVSLPLRPAWSAVSPLLEGGLAAAIVASQPSLPDALLPYLLVPPLAAGLLRGGWATLMTSATIAVSLTVSRGVAGLLGSAADRTALVQWIGLGLGIGLVGAWGRWSTLRVLRSRDEYREANRLLTQLRDIARALPTGFDEIGIGAALLDDLGEQVRSQVGVVSSLSDSGRLVPLTSVGPERGNWGAGMPEGPWREALDSGVAVTVGGQLDGSPGATAIIPLRLGQRRIGAVAMSRRGESFNDDELLIATRLVDDAALRLDTGRLFSDVRAWATVEERRRLSREIHDGIAQELTGLGFLLDDLAAHAADAQTRADLGSVRAELTRMISELRLSIFDLRSQVEPSTSLGTALSDYVRQVGTLADLTVHLVLDEDVRRLGVETETELLRIAQEAVGNARRHARARNLWVLLRVHPPQAFLRVADDGIGIDAPSRDDSYGMEIMRERATRIGAQLDFRPRVGGGTVVEVVLGHPSRDDLSVLERGSA